MKYINYSSIGPSTIVQFYFTPVDIIPPSTSLQVRYHYHTGEVSDIITVSSYTVVTNNHSLVINYTLPSGCSNYDSIDIFYHNYSDSIQFQGSHITESYNPNPVI